MEAYLFNRRTKTHPIFNPLKSLTTPALDILNTNMKFDFIMVAN